jgi:hypothetical protein
MMLTDTYDNLQIVQYQFFTDKLGVAYIRSNFNIYWFIGIWICCDKYKRRAIWLHSTIGNIWSAI